MHTGTQRKMSEELTGARRTSRGKNSPLPDRRRNIMKSERIGCKNE